ncbi:MAG: Smr/MutS family protein [Spirochaetaceae bacterium]|jgi:DNA-nicking Smr family endonuclease|nr:Smr/MutS family protein [Spirochaetaceae bacterium]
MNFGEILDRWEKGHSVSAASAAAAKKPVKEAHNAQAALRSWLDSYGVTDKDAAEQSNAHDPAERRQRLKGKAPEARLDLHGKTGDEAWRALEDFFRGARARNLEKVLLIHGKGNHSKDGAVLKELCRVYIEQCPFAGASGHPDANDGGSGATWVILK